MKIKAVVLALTSRTIRKPNPHDTSENDWWWFTRQKPPILLLQLDGGSLPILDFSDPQNGWVDREDLADFFFVKRSVGPWGVLFVSDDEELLRFAKEQKFIRVAISPASSGEFTSPPKCDSLTKIINTIETDVRF